MKAPAGAGGAAAAAGIVGLLAFTGCSRPAPPPAPGAVEAAGVDVLLVTIDTLRADSVGFAGNPRVKTPHLDRLAASGRVFTNAHAHNVVTLPSHANILTGLLPFAHGVRDNAGTRLADGVPTLATRLKERGYATAAFVAAFPLDRRFGLARGFDVYDDRYGKGSYALSFRLAERPGPEVVAPALAWWNAHPAGRRFLFVHLFEPHAPYAPPPPFDAEYRDDPYLGEVAAADAALAPLLAAATAPGARTFVVLTSDHGESLGEHGEATHGLFAYEATLRVPLIVAGPGVPPGNDDRSAAHVDIAPTVLAAAGAGADTSLPGRSLAAPAEARPHYFESLSAQLNRGWAPLTGVLEGRLKYVDLPIRELYDLASDPKELTNLASAREAELRDLARKLPAAASQPVARAAPSAEESARLRSLGYATGSSAVKTSYGPEDDPKRLVAVDQRIHDIVNLYQRGQLPAAIAEAERLVGRHPGLAVAVEHLAFLYQEAGRTAEAVKRLERLVAAGHATPELRVRLGLALSEMGRAGDAVKVLEGLRDSGDPSALNALGIAHADAGDAASARAAFTRATEADPDDPQAYQNLGIVALREGNPADARAHLLAALERNPRLPVALNTLGAAEAKLGNVEGALSAWSRAVSADPRDLDALYNLGMTAARNGRPEGPAALRRFVERAAPQRYGRELAEARAVLQRLAGGA